MSLGRSPRVIVKLLPSPAWNAARLPNWNAGIRREVVVHDPPELAAELERVAAAEVVRRVREHETGVGAALGEVDGPPKFRPSRRWDLRNPDRAVVTPLLMP